MSRPKALGRVRPCWFVGAAWGGIDDQTPSFVAEGIWKNGFTNKYNDLVRSMRPGDRIAIKASYVRKHGLLFDGGGQFVSVNGGGYAFR